MKSFYAFILSTVLSLLTAYYSFGQTSWTGATSTNWATASNWTAGVPTAATDVIIGNASFTGGNQPTISSTATCKSLTIGGTVTTTLTISSNITVSGDVIVNSNGTVNQGAAVLTLSGNWTKNGTYNTTSGSARVVFAGVSQSIGGSSVTTFRRITINAASTVTLNTNIIATGTNSYVYIYGVLNPNESPTYTVTSNVLFRIFNNGRAKVNASTFAGNYILSGTTTMSAGCIVEYAATTINQTVSNSYTYSTLVISGTGTTKTLAGNLTALTSSNTSRGNILVNSGTLDLSTYTANRGTSTTGGTISIGNSAILKIGGTNTFPANYNTRTLALSSTVEYYGTNQTVSAQTYGNLTLSSSSGAITKTMPGTAFIIEGNFVSSVGSGTSVSYTSASNITFNGNVTINTSTTFNGNGNSHTVRGSWTNNGTFTGSTGTVTFDGASTNIGGAGTQNFNNLSFTSTGITAVTGTSINVAGNLSTSGAGQFTHNTGGLLTMTGASKTISGSDIILNDLTVSGSVTASTSLTVNGNMSVSGTFTGTSGTVIMTGTAKTINGVGTLSFGTLSITGNITTASSLSVSSLMDVSGSFTATAGTATFVSSSVLSGTANLYNVTINGTSLQLSSDAVLGIANNFTITAGSLNVTSATPNTVNFNGTGAQSINAITYHHLVLSNGNTKTAAGNITVNGNLTISTATTFSGGMFTHTILKNWINNGSYTASLGTVQFTGSSNATITGVTTFNALTVNKSASTNTVSLLNNATAATVNMTSGTMLTGTNKITITTTRTGNGIILGTITRTHSFLIATAYAFEGPDNTITFSAVSGVTSITVSVVSGSVADFPNGSSINREYNISVPAGSYTAALRLHYEDAELNGNNESAIVLWKNISGTWSSHGKSANSTTSNYVEQSGLTNISYRWSCDENSGVVRWNGSVSSNWNTAANWSSISGSPSLPPSVDDVVQIGTASFTNQPTITTAVTVKSISFGSTQAATLTLSAGGSLTTNGNISGSWSSNTLHTISTGSQNLTVNGSLILSNGTNNQSISLNIGAGTVSLSGSLIQTGNAAVTFSGSGSLNLGGDFSYTSGTFTAGSGTVVYNGTGTQTVAPVNYNNLTINKSAGIASLASNANISGNLLITTGYFDVNTPALTIGGNVTINSGCTLDCDGVTISAAGNWTNSGTYVSTSATVIMNGTGGQSISAGQFNNLTVNKTSGTATFTGNNTIKGNLAIQAGTLDIATYTANRSTSGGSITIGSGAVLLIGGSNNFPSGYTTQVINAGSLVHYNGSVAQSVAGVTYGNLTFSNGGANAKTLLANATVAGDIIINSSSTFGSGVYTIALSGNWTNNGTFVPSTGTLTLNGNSKTITGNTTFNRVTVNGSYTVAGSNITYNGLFQVTASGSFTAGTGVATLNGDLTNSGSLTSSGTTTFTGTSLQTLHLINALISSSTGIVNFNGSVAPVMNSTSSPQFATLNINNTAGVNPSVTWSVFVAMNVNSGGIFNGGLSSHYIYGSFANAGTVTSTGTMNFVPATAKTVSLGSTGFSSSGTVNFGGAGQITITGVPTSLNNVLISNTNSAGISPPSNWSIDSNFVIASNAIFNAGSYTYTVGGDIQSDGTLNGGTSTFAMTSSAGDLTASAATSFNHFTIAGTITAQSDFRVAGNFTNNGVYDGSAGILIMTGSNAATIGGTTNPSSIEQLTIEKTSNAVVTQNVNIDNISLLNIYSGILFTSTRTITQNGGGGILIISDGATLRLGGTNSLPGFSGYGLDVNSNVDYAGTTQSVGNAASYGNLLITAAGNKNALVPVVVQGNLTISAGTLTTSTITVTHSIAGNFTMTGGTLGGTSGTYLLNGTGSQSLTLLSNLVNLTINKASGLVSLGSDITVNQLLNMTAGKIVLGNYGLSMGSSGSVTNASASSYMIATGTGTLNQQVNAGGSKAFPVGLIGVYTPAVVALAAGSTNDVISVRMLSSVLSQGTSGNVITENVVNATWIISENIAGGSNATVTLQWPASIELSGFNRTLSRMANKISGYWDYGTADIAASGSNPYTVSRSSLTGFSPFVVGMLKALPVVWLNVSGRNESADNIINWSVASEINNNYYVVEASTDGVNFYEIGRVNGALNTNEEHHYSFTHHNITERIYYYRIRQVDIDGKYSFSKTIRIVSGESFAGSIKILNNPILDHLSFSVSADHSFLATVFVTDAAGKQVFSQRAAINKGNNIMETGLSNLASGLYYVVFVNERGEKQSAKFLKR